MCELITLGETMKVFIPSSNGPLRYVNNYQSKIAGAESNVAIGVQKLGHQTSWISKLGADEFGYFILNSIRAEGVDTSQVIFDKKHKTGLMFKENTFSNKTKVTYYRDNSAASYLSPQDISENYIKKAKILHLTGITPILSNKCKDTVFRAIELAKKHDIMISFDPNIRLKLWKDNDFSNLIREILFTSNIILIGMSEAKKLFKTDKKQKIVETIFSYNNPIYLAIKDGEHGAWVASKHTDISHITPIKCKVIDSIGAGDAFNAGFLSGIIEGYDIEKCGKIGNVLGGLITQTPGDIEGIPSKEELNNILENKIVYR